MSSNKSLTIQVIPKKLRSIDIEEKQGATVTEPTVQKTGL